MKFEKQGGGTLVQTRVGTPHKLREQLGWGHRTTMKEQIQEPGGWWVGGLVKSDFITHSGSHQSTAWIQNPSSSRVWQKLERGLETN